MNQLDLYTKVLNYRRISKAIQQISWNLSKIEQKYKLDFDKASPEELKELIDFYEKIFLALNNLNNELNSNENKNNTH